MGAIAGAQRIMRAPYVKVAPMPLTDVAIKAAKPAEKARRLADSLGLYLEVAPSGGKWWRWKYRFQGKEKRLALGTYPDVSLNAARKARDTARELLGTGVDPGAARKREKARRAISTETAFEAIAREWHKTQATGWAESHAKTVIRRLERDVFPWLGARPLTDLDAPEILATLRRIEERGALETANRVGQVVSQIFRFAIASGRATRNPSEDLKGALQPVIGGHHAAVIEPKAFGDLLRAVRAYQGGLVVRNALQISALVFQRPGEVRKATWAEVDLDAALWVIPAVRMKRVLQKKLNGQAHYVPLSRQAVELFRELQPLAGDRGKSAFVFPGERGSSRPLSDNALRTALRTMGFDNDTHTPHGYRASARTMLDEKLKERPDFIDAQLAHVVKDPQGRAYNRTTFLPERTLMMQRWADYLDQLVRDDPEVKPTIKIVNGQVVPIDYEGA